jgi:GTP-binding protein
MKRSSITYGLYNAHQRGELFIPAVFPYMKGMVVAETPKQEDTS